MISEAETAEKARDLENAVAQYLQAAEILLLLAKVEGNYTAWKDYTDRASLCQQRARAIIAQSPDGRHGSPASPVGSPPCS